MNSQFNQHLPILVVEDSDEDFDVLKMTFEMKGIVNPILRASEGGEAMRLMEDRRGRGVDLPGLIILDLNLIGIDGREVLKRLKRDPAFYRIPVVVLSTSSSPKDVDACYSAGAASYSVKPVSLERLEKFVDALKCFWLETVILPRRSELDRWRNANG